MSDAPSNRPLVWIPREVHADAVADLETWADVRRGWGAGASTEAEIDSLVDALSACIAEVTGS